MSADEAASKITAGMKGMYARRQVRSAPILRAVWIPRCLSMPTEFAKTTAEEQLLVRSAAHRAH